MIEIKRPEDFGLIADETLRRFLRAQAAFVDELAAEGEDPAQSGRVLLLEASDDPRALPAGLGCPGDLTAVDCWEWAAHDPASDYWYAVLIVSDGYGLGFALPGGLARGCGLDRALDEVA